MWGGWGFMMCACVSEEDGNGDGVDFQELSGLSDTDLCGCVNE